MNAPKCPYANMMRDGMMQTAQPKGRANYEPNSLAQAGEDPGPRASDQGFATAPQQVEGQKLRIRSETFGDHFSQPRLFWRSQTDNERAHIASAFVFELSKVGLDHVRERVLMQLRNIDEDLAGRVAKGLGIALPKAATPFREAVDLDPSDALSIQKNWPDTLQGRTVGLLFSEGSDKAGIDDLVKAVEAEGGRVFTIAPKVGPQKLKFGTMTADGQLAASPSVLFDAVAMILAADEAKRLTRDAAALGFVMDAYAHLKAIGHCDGSKVILDRAGVTPDEGIVAYAELPAAASRRFREAGLRDLA